MPYYLFSYIIQIQALYYLSKKYLRVCHILSMQSYMRKVRCVQRDLWYCDLGSCPMLKIESGNAVIDCLDVIHHPAFIENVSETGLCLHPQVKRI
jgi:hypothetical protein